MSPDPRLCLIVLLALSGCKEVLPVIEPLPPVGGQVGMASPRVNGEIGSPDRSVAPTYAYGRSQPIRQPGAARNSASGDISLDFTESDIREVTAQILGTLLKVNYTIDPAVKGTATLHTSVPLSPAQLLPVLQTLLAQNNASLLQSGGLYRVVANAGAVPGAPVSPGAGPVSAGGDAVSGSTVVPLRYAGAEDLAKILTPFVAGGARITADPGRNALLINGDPNVRETLVGLIQAFDIDLLAGQSYAVFPATTGDVKDFSTSLQNALRGEAGGALAGQVRVVPMARMNAALVISSQPRYIDDARRVYELLEHARRETVRSWHVYYLQNSHASDAAYLLQQAFTPNAVTAQPSRTQTAPGAGSSQVRGSSSGGLGSSGIGNGTSAGLSGGGSGSGSAWGPGPVAAPPAWAALPIFRWARRAARLRLAVRAAGLRHRSAIPPTRCSAGSTPAVLPVRVRGGRKRWRCGSFPIPATTPFWSTAPSARRKRSRRCCARSTSCHYRCASTPPSPRSR